MSASWQPLPPAYARVWLRCGLAARLAASSELVRGAASHELLVVIADERANAGRALSTFFKAFLAGRDGELVVGALSGDSVRRFALDVGRVRARVERVPPGALSVLIAPLGELPVLSALIAESPLFPQHYFVGQP